MTINHLTAAEYIADQSKRIDTLAAEVRQLRQDNATLAALLLKLPATELTPTDLAQSLVAGCPQWRQVAAELVAMMASESLDRKDTE